MAKAAEIINGLSNQVEVLKSGKERVSSILRGARSNLTEVKTELSEAQKALDELRNEPFVDAAVGATIALGGGAGAGALDLAIGPITTLGGEEVKNEDGTTYVKGGIEIQPSLLTGGALILLGSQERSKSILDLGKAFLSGYGYGQSQRYLADMFTK